jgi:hypothetical protein
MSLLPLPKGIGDIDVKATVAEFLGVLKAMNAKLDVLIELEKGRTDAAGAAFCSSCDQVGSLRCPTHGQP